MQKTRVQIQTSEQQPFNSLFSRTTWVSRYQKGKTNLDFTGARESEWQWHQLGHMQVCTSFQTDNHASTPPLSFLQAGCPSCRPTNSVKALKAYLLKLSVNNFSTAEFFWRVWVYVYVGLNCLKIFVYVLFQAFPTSFLGLHPWATPTLSRPSRFSFAVCWACSQLIRPAG